MRFTTIWTMPAMTTAERLRQTREWAAMTTAARLPKRIRFWATVLEIGKATVNSPNIPETPLQEVLKNLDAPKNRV